MLGVEGLDVRLFCRLPVDEEAHLPAVQGFNAALDGVYPQAVELQVHQEVYAVV